VDIIKNLVFITKAVIVLLAAYGLYELIQHLPPGK
jgi:hypothetical protein